MSLPSFIQSKTYSTNTASTTHAITIDSAVRSQGGSVAPSALVATISYDGTTGSLVTGITDTAGNTWVYGNDGTNDVRTSNGAGVNGEMWYCLNAVGGVAPTITVTLSSSQKASIVVTEIDQVRSVSGLDRCKGNINTVASTSRSGLSGTKGQGMIPVVVEGICWNDASLTMSAASGYSGLVQIKDGSSNIAAAMAYKSSEIQTLSAATIQAKATMSAGTIPVAMMTLRFWRDGVITSTDEDGYIQNIEGTPTAYTSSLSSSPWGADTVYRSSTSAPIGGTGSSETDNVYSFFPDYSSYLLSGVTIGTDVTWNIRDLGTGFDDGTNWIWAFGRVYNDGTFGTTLTAADDGVGGASSPTIEFINDLWVSTSTWHTYTFNKSFLNTSGHTTAVIDGEGDTSGFTSSSWANLGDYDNNVPQYLVLTLTYPSLSSGPRLLASTGVGK